MANQIRVSRFSVDVTIPLGHRCMGLLPTKSKEIVDPLQTRRGRLVRDPKRVLRTLAGSHCQSRRDRARAGSAQQPPPA
jgi:hypothetical protein